MRPRVRLHLRVVGATRKKERVCVCARARGREAPSNGISVARVGRGRHARTSARARTHVARQSPSVKCMQVQIAAGCACACVCVYVSFGRARKRACTARHHAFKRAPTCAHMHRARRGPNRRPRAADPERMAQQIGRPISRAEWMSAGGGRRFDVAEPALARAAGSDSSRHGVCVCDAPPFRIGPPRSAHTRDILASGRETGWWWWARAPVSRDAGRARARGVRICSAT